MPKLEMNHHSVSGRGRRGRAMRVSTSLAEINVVPLVDVMLVLLVIFMVTAPMMQQGFGVKLPQARSAPPSNAEPVFVTVPATFHQDQRVQIGSDWVHLPVLSERARQAMDGRTEKSVTLRLDDGVTVGDEVAVMDQLTRGGVQSVTIATQPRAADKSL